MSDIGIARVYSDFGVPPTTGSGSATTVRERIVDNIVSALQNISIANGYNYDLKKARRTYTAGQLLKTFPRCMVLEGDERKSDGEEGPVGIYTCFLPIEIECWIRDTKEPPEDANIFLGDVERAIMQDPRRGELAINTELEGSSLMIGAEPEPRAYHAMRFTVHYRHSRLDSSQAR